MRKSLSLLLAIAMVFSMFSSLAFAADSDLTAQQKYDALADKGIFAGINGEAALDQNMNRAQFARVASLILGLEDISATDTSIVTEKPFSDVELGLWYTDEIAAAKEAGVFVGNADGTFNPKGDITVQELAVVAAGLLGLTPVEGAEVEGAADWAAGYIKAIQDAGIDFPTNYTEPATRADLASLAFTADAAINPEVPAVVAIASASATGAKKFEVKFNKAVDDTKATITVKKGSIATNIKEVKFSDDKKVATIETSTNLTAGDYTITVVGLTEEALTATVKAEDEKVTKIEFTSLNAPLDRADAETIYGAYTVNNQYGEDVTNARTSELTFTAGKGTATGNNGKLTINSPGVVYTKDEKVAVSILHANSTTFTNGVLVVADPARVAEIAITGLYHEDDKALEAGSVTEQFYLLVDAKDQYGVAATTTADVHADVHVSASNVGAVVPTLLTGNQFHTVNIDGTNHLAYKLPTGTYVAGTSKITIVSITTGKLASFDLVVGEVTKSDLISLSQPDVAVAGEKVTVPFTAVDQFGAELTDAAKLNAGTKTATIAGTNYPIAFERDHVKGETKLVVDTATASTGILNVTLISSTNKLANISITLKDVAVPTFISATKDFTKDLAVNGTSELKAEKIIVRDQYNREIGEGDVGYGSALGEFEIRAETSAPTRVSLTGTVINDLSDVVTLTGLAKGSSTITLKLYEYKNVGTPPVLTAVEVSNSAFTFSSKVVEAADIVSYEIADLPTILDADAASATALTGHSKKVVVKGTLADGSKIDVPTAWFQATAIDGKGRTTLSGTTLVVAAGDPTDYDDNKSTRDITVTAVVYGSETQQILTKTVTLSKSAPSASKLELTSVDTKVTKESDNVVSLTVAEKAGQTVRQLVDNAVKAIDQYDVELGTEPVYTIYDTNYNKVGGVAKTYATLAAGDSFQVAAITPNGKTITFKVVIK